MRAYPENKKIRILCVVGTRPEAIKMAPVVLALRENPLFEPKVLASGQHADMLVRALSDFGISADENLGIMKERQSLDHVTASVLNGTGKYLDSYPQDMVLVHGDTTTTFAASLAAFYRKTPLGHVEAGLRSHDLDRPFPEEANRVLTDRLTTLCFAPTRGAADNLLAEGVNPARVFVTGNTVIDALYHTLKHAPRPEVLSAVPPGAPLLLMTAHRRESWGEPMARICRAVRALPEKYPELWIIVPLHSNPAVREIIREELKGCPRIVFTEPLDYPDFIAVMNRSLFILSDSGGIQEEASALGRPVLILRDLSERPEAVSEGTGILVGTDDRRIEKEALRLLEGTDRLKSSVSPGRGKPFGDGKASIRIVNIIENYMIENYMDKTKR